MSGCAGRTIGAGAWIYAQYADIATPSQNTSGGHAILGFKDSQTADVMFSFDARVGMRMLRLFPL